MRLETIVFGGGCFWCTEATFSQLNGVNKITPGYAGGNTFNPTYEQVCTGKTGHAEVIKIEYDADIINFSILLDAFFVSHNPTTLNQQGNDLGTQYRSIILYTSAEQKVEAENYINDYNKNNKVPAVTEIKPLNVFYPAEDHHKNYYQNNRNKPYCLLVIDPKIKKLRSKLEAYLK